MLMRVPGLELKHTKNSYQIQQLSFLAVPDLDGERQYQKCLPLAALAMSPCSDFQLLPCATFGFIYFGLAEVPAWLFIYVSVL